MNKQFEDILRNKFNEFEAPVSDDLFDRIITERKKRGGLVWFRYGSLMVAAVLLITALKFGFDHYTASPVTEAEPVVQHSEEMMGNSNTPVNSALEEENIIAGSEGESIEEPSFTPASQEIVQNGHQATINERSASVPQLIKDTEVSSTQTEEIDADAITTVSNILEEAEKNVEQSEVSKSTEVIEPAEQIVMDDSKSDVEEDSESEEPVDFVEFDQPEDQDDDNSDDLIFHHKLRRKISIGAFAGPGYAGRNYIGSPELAQFRMTSESPSLSYQYGFNVNYRLTDLWTVGIGVTGTSRNEIFSYDRYTLSTDTNITSRQVVVYDPVLPPVVKTVFDTAYVTNETVERFSDRNCYSRISIPLSFERWFYQSNKWSLNLNSGALFSIYSSQIGTARYGVSELVDLADLKVKRYGDVTGFVGIGASYRLNSRLELNLRPQIHFDISQSQTGLANLDLRQYGVFTNIGLQIRL